MSGGASKPLVSVVIPLHNGLTTVERTLDSVMSQTWTNLEIIVVDDGSTDEGPALVEAMAARDTRIRLIRQANGGVARARNYGASQAKGDFFAFVDADDLWAPEKIALQTEALIEGGERAGLAYTWAALIDENDRIYSLSHQPTAEGEVFRDLCRANIVGNGSSPLIRRSAFEAIGGYDPSLRDRGAQGCEDLMIYLRVAEHYEFRLIPRHLTGYRVTQGNMSSNARKMLRSCEIALATFSPRYPQYAAEFKAHRRDMIYWLLVRALTTGPMSNAFELVAEGGLSTVHQICRRALGLTWLTIKAHAPASLKQYGQKVLRKGGEFRPVYLEASL